MSELLPCPFCGSEPELSLSIQAVEIYCTGCAVRFGAFFPDQQEHAITAWNTRYYGGMKIERGEILKANIIHAPPPTADEPPAQGDAAQHDTPDTREKGQK